jgi:hypothetical protein
MKAAVVFSLPDVTASGFHWRWRSVDGTTDSVGHFGSYQDCAVDAQANGYSAQSRESGRGLASFAVSLRTYDSTAPPNADEGTPDWRCLLAAVSARTVQELLSSAETLKLPDRTLLFNAGDMCRGLHVILSGRVKLFSGGSESAQLVIGLLGPGTWFGETALLGQQRHAAAAVTVEKSEFTLIPAATVLRCLKEDHAFAMRMLTETSRRLRATLPDRQ